MKVRLKKALSLLLALAMCLGMLPGMAWATDDPEASFYPTPDGVEGWSYGTFADALTCSYNFDALGEDEGISIQLNKDITLSDNMSFPSFPENPGEEVTYSVSSGVTKWEDDGNGSYTGITVPVTIDPNGHKIQIPVGVDVWLENVNHVEGEEYNIELFSAPEGYTVKKAEYDEYYYLFDKKAAIPDWENIWDAEKEQVNESVLNSSPEAIKIQLWFGDEPDDWLSPMSTILDEGETVQASLNSLWSSLTEFLGDLRGLGPSVQILATGDASDFFAARIGDTGYETLTEAIAAAQNGDTIKLLADVTEIVTISGKTLTLDLNGCNITSTSRKQPITVNNGTKLTIVNTNTEKSANDATQNAIMGPSGSDNYGSLNAKGTNTTVDIYAGYYYGYNGNKTAINAIDGATVTFYGGVVNGAEGVGDTTAGKEGKVFYSGVSNPTKPYATAPGYIVVHDGNFSGRMSDSNWGNYTLYGGTFDRNEVVLNENPVDANGNRVATASSSMTSTGTGTFADAGWLAPDHKVKDNGDGTYTVVPKTYLAEVDGTKYETLDEAVAAAIRNKKDIYLLADCRYAPNNALSKLDVTKETTFTVRGNGFYGAYFANKTDIANGAWVNTWTKTGYGENAVYTYTIKPATVGVVRSDDLITYPTALYQSLNGVDSEVASANQTVIVYDDIDLDSSKAEIEVKNTNVTLDLDTWRITLAKEGHIAVKAGNTFTIKDGTINGNGSVKVGEGATLNLNHATVNKIYALAGATIVLSDGAGYTTIKVPDGYEAKDNGNGTYTVEAKGFYESNGEYHINSLAGLKAFRDSVNSGVDYSGKTVYLDADIDLDSIANWEPIGKGYYNSKLSGSYRTDSTPFKGTFDGQEHTISNLKVRTDGTATQPHKDGKSDDVSVGWAAGLFGIVEKNGTVKNLTIENATVSSATRFAGAVAGGVDEGTIEKCTVTGEVNISGKHFVGGITGWTSKGTIKDCSVTATGTISAEDTRVLAKEDDRDGDDVGGIVGYSTGTVKGNTVSSTGTLTVEGQRSVDAVVGAKYGTIENNIGSANVIYNIWSQRELEAFRAEVNAGRDFAGAIVNLKKDIALSGTWTPIGTEAKPFKGTFNGNGKTISGLNVTGTADYVGLFGYVQGATLENVTINGATVSGTKGVGTVVGRANNSTIDNCNVEGNIEISGTHYVGGVVGYVTGVDNNPGVISSCIVTATGTIASSDSTGEDGDDAGGIAGFINYARVSNCRVDNTGLTISADRQAGGLIGLVNQISTKADFSITDSSVNGVTIKATTNENTRTFDEGGNKADPNVKLTFGGLIATFAQTSNYSVTGCAVSNVKLTMGEGVSADGLRVGYVTAGRDILNTTFGSGVNISATVSNCSRDADLGNVMKDKAGVNHKAVFIDGISIDVAQIGSTKYATLQAAFDAAENGDTVTLLENVTIDSRVSVNGTMEAPLSKSVTLDMNDKNIDGTGRLTLRGGSLNITGNGTISTTAGGVAPVDIYYTGDPTAKRALTIGEGVTLDGSDSGYGLNIFGTNNATYANSIDVTINGTVKSVVFVLGNLTNDSNAINITANNKAKIVSTGTGIALNGYANLTVNDGATISGTTAVEVRAGNLTVNGGTFTASGTTYTVTANGSGTTSKGVALAVSQHTTAKKINVKIMGGTFTGPCALGIANPQENRDTNVTVSVTGGKFKGEIVQSVVNADNRVTGFITDGLFDDDPTNSGTIINVATGYEAVKLTDGENINWYQVGKVQAKDLNPTTTSTGFDKTYTATKKVVDTTDATNTLKSDTTITVNVKGTTAENSTSKVAAAAVSQIADSELQNVVNAAIEAANTNADTINVLIEVVSDEVSVDSNSKKVTFEVHPEAIAYVNDEKVGSVEIENGQLAAGAKFSIKLPVPDSLVTVGGTKIAITHVHADGEAEYLGQYEVKGSASGYYVEIENITSFSEFELVAIDPTSSGSADSVISLTLQESISYNLYVYNLKAGTNAADYTVVIDGVEKGPLSNYKVTTTDGSDLYKFVVASCPAKNMGDTHIAQVKYGETIVVNRTGCSIREYCEKVLAPNSSYSEKLKNLCYAVLDYGASAQQYLGYETGTLVNSNYTNWDAITDVPASVNVRAKATDGMANNPFSATAQSLTLKDRIEVGFYFVLKTGDSIENYTFKLNNADVEASSLTSMGNNIYKLSVSGIAPKDLAKEITVKATRNGNDGLYEQITYSPLSYAYTMDKASTAANLRNVCRTLYHYYEAASAYFD